MKVQILGTGCPKCKMLFDNAEEAIQSAGVDATIEKIEKVTDIMAFGVISTPALAVDGTVKSAGKVLSPEEIKNILG